MKYWRDYGREGKKLNTQESISATSCGRSINSSIHIPKAEASFGISDPKGNGWD
jgi:hypothetical protein